MLLTCIKTKPIVCAIRRTISNNWCRRYNSNKTYSAVVFEMNMELTRQRLKNEHKLTDGKELGKMRKANIEINENFIVPTFAYI